MKIVQPVEDKFKREIRLATAKDPTTNVAGMQEHLEKVFDRGFSREYVSKLMHKVMGEARANVDRAKINNRIIQLRQTHEIARLQLLKVVCWEPDPNNPTAKPPGYLTIVEAAKNLVMLDIAVLNAEVANGVYKNIEEASNNLRYPTLPDESRTHIMSAFEKWGMLPPATVHQIVQHQTTTLHATRVITTG